MNLVIYKRKSWILPAAIAMLVAAIALPVALLVHSASAVATSATIGGNTRSIDGVNTWRGTNQMIMYTYSAAQTSVPTNMSNQWGIEVAVNASGVITAKNDRLQSGSTTGTPIPAGGYVLSGHGWGVSTSGYTWLLQNAQVGQLVTLNGSTPTQPPSGFNADGVKLAAPAVTVNGTNVTYNWTVETNKSVTFRYLQVAVRPAPDTGFNNNVTINGSRSFTASRAHTSGNYTAFIAYQLPNGNWVNGPSVDYTVGGTTPSDTTAPSVSLSAPGNNASVTKGDGVAIAATASDNVGVAKVEFLVDGSVVSTDTSSPYGYSWDTTSANAGNHTIVAKAYDAAGNVGTSSTVNVTVAAPQPTISATATLNGDKATLSWTTTGANPAEWTVARDGTDSGGYGAWSENVPGDRRSHTFNYLRPGDTYTLTVSAADGRTASAIVTVPTTEPADTTAPTTSITSPANNSSAVIGNAVTITANASDNVGVSKVEFLVNGVVVATDTSAPYSYTWDTSGKTAGNYALTTRAYDAANNTGSSSSVQISLTGTPPSSGDWLSGVATVENGNGADPAKYFSDWRGTPVEIGQTWPHTPDVWGVNPSVANSWSGFQGPMSLSYNPGVNEDGTIVDWRDPATGQVYQGWRGWSAMANGNMDAWWRAAAKQTKEFRQGKGTTYVSPFYEYNGDWMTWSVPRTTQGMADFRAAWERVAAIWRREFPGVRLVLPAACSRDVPAAMMPNPSSYDHIGCTIYNAWPWEGNGAINVQRMEVGRQRALANGKSLVITEWANSGNPNEQGGGGDSPGFIQAFHSYFTQHAGTGPGQLEFETFFNIDGYALDHILVRRNGTGVTVNSTQPQTAAKYQQLF